MIEKIIRTDNHGTFDCTIKELQIGKQVWRYSISGNGSNTLLALLGNVVGHYFALPLAEELQDQYKVIALSVPPLPEFSLSGAGLATIIRHENIACCHAIGHSNGGVHIQNLVRYCPDFVDKIIFSYSLTSLSDQDACTVNDTEVNFYRKAKAVMKILPASILLNGIGGKFAKRIQLKAGPQHTKAIQERIISEVRLLNKNDVLAIINCMEDFLFHHTFSSADYCDRANRILLLNSPSDKMVNPRQKSAMRQLCPNAKEYVFQKGGHTPMITYPEEYYRVVKDFLC